MPTFATLYFSFPHKGIQYDTLVFSKNVGANCAYSSSLEINGIKFIPGQKWKVFFSKCLLSFHRYTKTNLIIR